MDHEQTTTTAFTDQAAGFDSSAVANDRAVLDAIVGAAQPGCDQRWLEAASGPGIVSRALSPHVTSVYGIDLTEEMVCVARRRAREAGADNATFAVGDATSTPLPDGSVDGAVTRSSIHHLPVPGRLFDELARVVVAGGRIIVVDHLADEDLADYAWAQEVERLRDASHWASLTAARLRGLGERAGLRLESERRMDLELDFEDWLARGTRDPAAQALVRRAIAERPEGTACFALRGARLGLRMWLGVWVRP